MDKSTDWWVLEAGNVGGWGEIAECIMDFILEGWKYLVDRWWLYNIVNGLNVIKLLTFE